LEVSDGRQIVKPQRLLGGWRVAAAAVVVAAAAGLFLAADLGLVGERQLVVAFDDVPATLDPHLHNETVVWSVLSNFYDGLVVMTPDMRLEAALAVSRRQEAPTVWRVTLREDVEFSNGDRFSAADVVASFRRASSHARSAIRHQLLGITDIAADGDRAVVITTRRPAPDLLNRLAFLPIIPVRDAGKAEVRVPVGTGPYRFVAKEDDAITARAWRSWRAMPSVKRVRMEFRERADEVTLTRLLGGAIDVVAGIRDEDLPRVESRRGFRLEPQPRLAVQLLAVASGAAQGTAGRALADPRVRHALLLALNRPAWIDTVFRGNATVASQLVHPVVFGYDPTLQALPFDPGEARRLLAEAGFASGFDVQLGVGSGLPPALLAAFGEDLARIGVRVTPYEATFGELVRLARTGEVPLFYYAHSCSTGDASDFLNSSLHTRDEALGLGADNFTGYSDPEVDRLLAEAEEEMSPARRLELLQQAQRRALAALPVLPLTVRWGYLGVSDRVDVVTRHDRRLWAASFTWR